ncbi:MAG: mannose-1-phosphate guanylyltransferase [Actinomycetota bacterium]
MSNLIPTPVNVLRVLSSDGVPFVHETTTFHADALPGFHAIVPAGGAGTRLWPLSRRGRPKFLLDLTGSGRSLLQGTYDRLVPLAEHVVVVTGAAHAPTVAEQLPGLSSSDLIVEPSPRDSAAAIGVAAAVVHARDPEAVIGSFAADHVITGPEEFNRAVAEAVAVARTGLLVTVGIEPTSPSTGFGYIKSGAPLVAADAPSAQAVAQFVEKPDAVTAAAYLADGGYWWNAGMFVARAATLLELFDEYRPALAADLRRLGSVWDTPSCQTVLAQVWPQIEKVAIDYALAEPAAAAGRVAVIPGTFSWDDIGDFASLADVLGAAQDAPMVRRLGSGMVLAESSTGLAVADSGRLVAVLGLDDVVVVDTPDVILVTSRDRSQEVKALVDRLASEGSSLL